MKAIFALLGLGLVTIAKACANPGDTCSDWGATTCECNEGWLLTCETFLAPIVDGEGGETEVLWSRTKNCPVPADGGAQCVDNACAS